MDTHLFFSLVILILWISLLLVTIYCGKRYEGCRGEAFSKMKRIKIAVYLIPLMVSVILVIFFYPALKDNFLGFAGIYIIGIGAISWIVLFDVFESRKVKLSRTEQKR